MTMYLLMREPELNASEAITKSQKMMKGHKMRLFILDLSFIGWDLLETITFGLLAVFVEPFKRHAKTAFFNNVYENANVVSENKTESANDAFNIDPQFVVDVDVNVADEIDNQAE